ncbi:MAG: SUMF1/EgtB/PvdO family nonheme iron enzyme [Polyangiaceae bacterium]|nr:SUMF1/EgtB/PvdO family nonheme iron enzyme [Polyangiaceae bacterium]
MTRSVSFRVLVAACFTLGVTALGAMVVRLQAAEVPLDMMAGAAGEKAERKPQREWRLVDGKHWQIVGPEGEDPNITDQVEGNRGRCTPGMVEVTGNMKADPSRKFIFDPNSIEEMQKKTCKKWIQREYPERCAEFDREAWLKMSKDMPTQPMSYCMDRFEYPNRKGAHPVIFINFGEAKQMCASQGKRLCTEDEWTFACEGEEATPYPYGYVRSPDKCPIDGKWRAFNEKSLRPREGYEAMFELDRLWQGTANGGSPGCKSAFGVYDLTGNVDEWTQNVREGERNQSILKGGYWGPVRTRCRPSTRSHDENHIFYQQGFRCCSDVPAGASAAPGIQLEAPPPTSIDPSRSTSAPP